MSKSKKKKIIVHVQVNVDTTVEVLADSLEDALTQARELGVRDIVSFEGDFNDGSIKVTGAFE